MCRSVPFLGGAGAAGAAGVVAPNEASPPPPTPPPTTAKQPHNTYTATQNIIVLCRSHLDFHFCCWRDHISHTCTTSFADGPGRVASGLSPVWQSVHCVLVCAMLTRRHEMYARHRGAPKCYDDLFHRGGWDLLTSPLGSASLASQSRLESAVSP